MKLIHTKEEDESWEDIKGFEGIYKINRKGHVQHYPFTARGIKNRADGDLNLTHRFSRGYVTVSLSKDGRCRIFGIHRLLAIQYIPNPLNLSDVNHINNDRSDYSLGNLEWVSQRENLSHGRAFHKKTSKYTGVCLKKNTGKWRAFIRIDKKGIWLGDFTNEEDASLAYKSALIKYKIINKYA